MSMHMRGRMPTTGIKKGTFGRLLKYVGKNYTLELIIVVICIILSSISSVIATMFMQRLIDECIVVGVFQGLDAVWEQLIEIITTMASIYLVGIIAAFVWTRIMGTVTQGTLMHFRDDMYSKMESLPIKYFDTHAHGDIMSTYTNDTDATRQLIGQSLPTLLQSGVSMISILATMLYFSVWLTLVVVAVAVLMLSVVKKVGGSSSKYMVAQQSSLAREEGFIEEMIGGLKVIKVFNHEEEGEKEFAALNDKLFEDSEKAHYYGNVLMPILGNMGNLLYVILAIVGGVIAVLGITNVGISGIGVITVGIIASFLYMSRQFSQTIGQTSMQVAMIAMGLAGAGRIFELIDEQAEEDDGYVTLVNVTKDENGLLTETEKRTDIWAWKCFHKAEGTTTYTELLGDIVFEDVDFGYNPNELVLKNISLYARPGQKIAFVGATGAGKTTITNLINRFYDIPDGKVRYDGINVTKIRKPDLRRSLAVVLQDVNLFTGSVMENIRYGRLDATDEECIRSAKLANADDFISRLPEGYNTVLHNNGSGLSQGQRQLISIARAAVADPPVLILDEATSSIDTRTETIVQRGMDALMEGRTVFVIAHRLSTIQNSDVIMVLDKGRITERGNHQQLLAEKGTYYQLFTGAFELE